MNKIYHPLLALIASATDNELAKYVEYLKHEGQRLHVVSRHVDGRSDQR